MLTHIVLFKIPNPDVLTDCRDRLMSLPAQIPEIKHFEVGLNVVASDRAYDLALYSQFDSLEAMQVYQVHPAHVEVSNFMKSVSESVVSVDYEV